MTSATIEVVADSTDPAPPPSRGAAATLAPQSAELQTLEGQLRTIAELLDERARARSWLDRHLAAVLLLVGGVCTAGLALIGTIWSGRVEWDRTALELDVARQRSADDGHRWEEDNKARVKAQQEQLRHEILMERCRQVQGLHSQVAIRAVDAALKAGKPLSEGQLVRLGSFPTCDQAAIPLDGLLFEGVAVARPATAATPPPPKPRIVQRNLSVISYASSNNQKDSKVIEVPPGCKYISHSARTTTRNVESDTGYSIEPSNPNEGTRVITVRTRAGGKPIFGAGRWIGIELNVVVECRE